MYAPPQTRHRSWPWVLALSVVLALAAPDAPRAHEQAKHGAHGAAPAAESAKADVELLDLELLDSHGRPVRFASEVMGERIVAIDFVYTTCTTICPIVSAVFAGVQDEMGERLGKDVWLITISIDPSRDTPKRMRKYADKFGAKPGWMWLTGGKTTVDQVLTGLGAYSADIEDHPPMFVVGDAKSGIWKRLFGLSITDEIVAQLEDLLAARQQSATSTKHGE